MINFIFSDFKHTKNPIKQLKFHNKYIFMTMKICKK